MRSSIQITIETLRLQSSNTLNSEWRAEIVCLNADGTHYVIAYWTSNTAQDEFSLTFVSGRPFNCDLEAFWYLAKEGQRLLESGFLTTEE